MLQKDLYLPSIIFSPLFYSYKGPLNLNVLNSGGNRKYVYIVKGRKTKPYSSINLSRAMTASRLTFFNVYVYSLEENIYLHVLPVYLNYSIPNYLYYSCFSLVEFYSQIHSP
jgi:hypothetical protein